MVCLTRRQWNQSQSATLSYHFSPWDWTLPPKDKKRGHKSKVNQLYREKRTFECAGRFSDFFIKIEGSQVLNKNRLSSFDIKLHYFHSFYYLSSFLGYPCFFVNLYCLNFLKLWEKKFPSVELFKKKDWVVEWFFFKGSWEPQKLNLRSYLYRTKKAEVVFVWRWF